MYEEGQDAGEFWHGLADLTRPLQPAFAEADGVLKRVVAAVDHARTGGLHAAELGHVRGTALDALAKGNRSDYLAAIARIYTTSLLERARLNG